MNNEQLETPQHIGTYRESSLHAALKQWYAREGDQIEVPIDKYHIDIVRDDLLIEIQTRSFSSIKAKLAVLLENHAVKLVHPIPLERWLVDMNADGTRLIRRRKSPRKGQCEHVFNELVRIPNFIEHPNFSVDVLLVHDEEIRRDDGKGSWRRKGRSIHDRRLIQVIEHIPFTTPTDFAALLPHDLPEEFTTADIARGSRLSPSLARKMAYCLRKMNAIERISTGRRHVYRKL